MSRLLSLLLFPVLLSAQEPTLSVLPTPREVTHFDATFRIDSETRVVLQDPENESDAFTAEQIVAQLENQFGLALEIDSEQATVNWNNLIYLGKFRQESKAEELAEVLSLPDIMDLGEEGYYLQISDSLVVLCANSSHGLFNAAMTITQLMRTETEPELSGVTIYDYPEMQTRGFSLDMSHGSVPNLQTLKELIRFLSRYKVNTCVLHFGLLFDYQQHPKISEGRGVLSKTEISELQNFASQYHVQIIPAVSPLSGWEPILRLPEYRELALIPGGPFLDPDMDEAYRLLEELLIEVTNAFESQNIVLNFGGPDGDGFPDIKSHLDAEMITDHIHKVMNIVKGLEKRPLFIWNEPLPGLSFDSRLASKGTDRTTGNGYETLFTAPISDGNTLFPNMFSMSTDIGKKATKAARTDGMIASVQSKPFGPAFQQLNQYGFVYAAEATWSSGLHDFESFNDLYFSQIYPEAPESAKLVFLLFADFPHNFWQQMWRHPYLASSGKGLQSRILKMRTQFRQALDFTVNVEVRNGDYFRYVAKHGIWLADKLDAARQLHQLRSTPRSIGDPEKVSALVEQCRYLIEELNAIIEDFQLLWLRSNRMEDSPRFLDLYSLQVAYWQEVTNHLETGQFEYDPLLESAWIAHPPGSCETSHAFFRKTFDVAPGFRNAALLVIPDARMKVYINGAFLDEALRPAVYSGVNVWDIGSVLQPGKNVIAVEAWSDVEGDPAAINLYGEIEYEFGKTHKIISDVYWKTSTQDIPDWQKLGFFDVQWLNTVPVERDMTIIRPDFRTRRPAVVVK